MSYDIQEAKNLSKIEVFGHFLELGWFDGVLLLTDVVIDVPRHLVSLSDIFPDMAVVIAYCHVVVNGLHDLALVIIQVGRSVNVCIALPFLIYCHPTIPPSYGQSIAIPRRSSKVIACFLPSSSSDLVLWLGSSQLHSHS